MKTRKKTLYGITIALTVAISCLFNSVVSAQSTQGIYLSAADFANNKLSYEHGSAGNCKIKIHDGSFNSPIKITCGETVLHLSKNSVYGFKDHENISHRFYNKAVYEIINPGANIVL